LASNDKQLKGYKDVDFYIDHGAYKYTIGETANKETINATWNKVRKDFKGAFIIEMKDGKRIR
jgi:N-acetylmuramoyl-L-alanine amidase